MMLPKRLRAHSLEDVSRMEFERLLPEEWICRDIHKDYGIDLEVEIVNNELVSGKKFYVQLKATDTDKISCPLNITTLNYYNQLNIPVIIVRYMSQENLFYGKYFNDIDFSPEKNTETFSVNFNENNIINESFFENLESYLYKIEKIKNISFPISIFLDFDNLTDDFKTNFEIQSSIEEVIGHDFVTFTEDKKSSLVHFEYSKNTLTFHIPELKGIVFSNIKYDNMIDPIFISLILLLNKLEKSQMLSKLVFENSLEDFIIENKLLDICFENFLCSSYIKETDNLFELIIKDTSQNEDIFKSYALLMYKLLSKCNYFDRFKHILEKCSSTNVSLYNLGSFLRKSYPKKAIRLYIKALKKDGLYKNKDYFYKELGGLFFIESKFKWAKTSYKKALELNGQKSNKYKFLYADTLIFCGEYKNALDILLEIKFNEKDASSSIAIETFIKINLLMYIVNDLGIIVQDRTSINFEETSSYTKNLNILSTDEIKKDIMISLNKDPLNALTWFNFAYTVNDPIPKALAYSYAGVLNNNDLEALTNAFISFFNAKEDSEAIAILSFIFKKYGKNVINTIIKEFPVTDQYTLKNLKLFLSQVYENSLEKEPIYLRIHNEDQETVEVIEF